MMTPARLVWVDECVFMVEGLELGDGTGVGGRACASCWWLLRGDLWMVWWRSRSNRLLMARDICHQLCLGLSTMSHSWAICQTGRRHLYCLPISTRDPSGLRSHFPHCFYSNSSHTYLWQNGDIRVVDITFVIIYHFLLGYLLIDKVILSVSYRILMTSMEPHAMENLVTISFGFLMNEGILFSTQMGPTWGRYRLLYPC